MIYLESCWATAKKTFRQHVSKWQANITDGTILTYCYVYKFKVYKFKLYKFSFGIYLHKLVF